MSDPFSLRNSNVEYNNNNASSVTTSFISTSSNNDGIKNGETSSFNGHTIQQTIDPKRGKLIQNYLEAKEKFEKALEKYEYAKGLNWFARKFWNFMPVGKSRSVNHCARKLEHALSNYDLAGIALATPVSNPRSLGNNQQMAEEKRTSPFDHRSLNNQANNSTEKLQIGVNKLPTNIFFKAGAILRHEIDQYDTQLRASIKDPWNELERDTKNGTWQIKRDSANKITSISYDDMPPSKENSSDSIEDVIAAIKEFAGSNKEAQEAAAYAIHPNSFSTIALIKTQLPNDSPRLIKNAQELRSLRQLDRAGSIRTEKEEKNFKTVLSRNANQELTVSALQKTKRDCLITCDQNGGDLNENDSTHSFTHEEEDSFTRVIKQNPDGSASIQTENLLLREESSDVKDATLTIS
ncbi:MAG: hypothetical protein K2W99_00830 [Chthoniobacterales bacterium]|nr:hypothetical protein [Chthoniobacterales bacterium]